MTTNASNNNGIRSREELKKIRQNNTAENSKSVNKMVATSESKIDLTASDHKIAGVENSGTGTEASSNNSETEDTREKRQKRIRIRMIPIWLRLLIVIILSLVSVALGTVVGYSVIGEGEAADVFNKETWFHIIDFISKE